jgi:hypothetical protein
MKSKNLGQAARDLALKGQEVKRLGWVERMPRSILLAEEMAELLIDISEQVDAIRAQFQK